MLPLAARIDDFLQAPLAAAVFTIAARNGLDAEHLCDPATASTVASTALCHLNPWTGEAAKNRTRALTEVESLRELVTAVVTDPRNAWWSTALDRSAQLLFTDDTTPQHRDPMHSPVPTGPIGGWETYAQKPRTGVATSTELPVSDAEPIRSGAHAELACGCSDWNPTYPVGLTRLQVASGARVFEIDSAGDWHRLCLQYGDLTTHAGSDTHLMESAGVDNGLAPTWSAVAEDYDGVHLTFAGLLTGLYVPLTTGGVSTTLWAWDWESTHWLRPVFTAATALEDLPEPPERPDYCISMWE